MNAQEITQALCDELLALGAGEIDTVDPDVPLSALGVDSLLRVALLDKVEGRYGLDVGAMEVDGSVTISQLVTAIVSALEG